MTAVDTRIASRNDYNHLITPAVGPLYSEVRIFVISSLARQVRPNPYLAFWHSFLSGVGQIISLFPFPAGTLHLK
jgi:hypothetical protein